MPRPFAIVEKTRRRATGCGGMETTPPGSRLLGRLVCSNAASRLAFAVCGCPVSRPFDGSRERSSF